MKIALVSLFCSSWTFFLRFFLNNWSWKKPIFSLALPCSYFFSLPKFSIWAHYIAFFTIAMCALLALLTREFRSEKVTEKISVQNRFIRLSTRLQLILTYCTMSSVFFQDSSQSCFKSYVLKFTRVWIEAHDTTSGILTIK